MGRSNKELTDEQFNSIFRHNKKVQEQESKELHELEDRYKDRLPDRTKEVEKFDAEFQKGLDNAKLSGPEKFKALKNSVKNQARDAKFHLKYKNVKAIGNNGHRTETVSLTKRISNAARSLSPSELKATYKAEKDGLKHAKAYEHAKRWESKQDTPIEKEYLSEWNKVIGKYSTKYKKYDDSDLD